MYFESGIHCRREYEKWFRFHETKIIKAAVVHRIEGKVSTEIVILTFYQFNNYDFSAAQSRLIHKQYLTKWWNILEFYEYKDYTINSRDKFQVKTLEFILKGCGNHKISN